MNLISSDLEYYFMKDLVRIIIEYFGNPEQKEYNVCLICSKIGSSISINDLCTSFNLNDKQELINLVTPFRKMDYCGICYPYYLEFKIRKKKYKSKLLRDIYQEIYIEVN